MSATSKIFSSLVRGARGPLKGLEGQAGNLFDALGLDRGSFAASKDLTGKDFEEIVPELRERLARREGSAGRIRGLDDVIFSSRSSDYFPSHSTQLFSEEALGKKPEKGTLELFHEARALDAVYDPKDAKPAEAFASESDLFGQAGSWEGGKFIPDPGGGSVYSKIVRDAIENNDSQTIEALQKSSSFQDARGNPIGFTEEGIKGIRLKQEGGGSPIYYPTREGDPTGGLETAVAGGREKWLHDQWSTDEGWKALPKHLKLLRTDIQSAIFERVPMDGSDPVAGTAWKLIRDKDEGVARWEGRKVTEKEAKQIYGNQKNMAGKFDKYKLEDWKFVDEQLSDYTGAAWPKVKEFIDKEGLKQGTREWKPPPSVDWKGDPYNSAILQNILRAVDNAVESRTAKVTKEGDPGLIDDPRNWYYMGQLHDDYKREWGDIVGTRLFLDFVNMIGASTTAMSPSNNFIAASYFDWLNFHKQIFTGQQDAAGNWQRYQGNIYREGKDPGSPITPDEYTFKEDLVEVDIPLNQKDKYFTRNQWDYLKEEFGDAWERYAHGGDPSGVYVGKDMGTAKAVKDEFRQLFPEERYDELKALGIDPLTKKGKRKTKAHVVVEMMERGKLSTFDRKKIPEDHPLQEIWKDGFESKKFTSPIAKPDPDQEAPLFQFYAKPGGSKPSFYAPPIGAGGKSSTHLAKISSRMQDPEWLDSLVTGASMIADNPEYMNLLKGLSPVFRLDPSSSVKGAHFASALAGNIQAVTMDKVMTNTMFARKGTGAKPFSRIDAPNPNEYEFLARYIQDIAAGYDMSPAALQAVVWLGSAEKEKLAGTGASAIRTIDERIRLTTAFLNRTVPDSERLTPRDVLRLVIRKEIPLLGTIPAMNMGLELDDDYEWDFSKRETDDLLREIDDRN